MKAVLCTPPRRPRRLELVDLPGPVPRPGEAVVKIEAAGLNFSTPLIIAGNTR